MHDRERTARLGVELRISADYLSIGWGCLYMVWSAMESEYWPMRSVHSVFWTRRPDAVSGALFGVGAARGMMWCLQFPVARARPEL